MELILFGVVALAVVGWFYLRRRSKGNAVPADSLASEDARFHAVSIHYSEGACTTAKTLSGQRFLAEDAPKLPLPGCDAQECLCHFTHYEDRRSTVERRVPFSGVNYAGTSRSRLQERRKGKNRRSEADEDID
jgi:hypothetical protein